MSSLNKSQREARNEVYNLLKIASRIADTDGLVSVKNDINAILRELKWHGQQERKALLESRIAASIAKEEAEEEIANHGQFGVGA